MTVREPGSGSGAEERPVPRDLPDQQAGFGEDPWDVTPGHAVDDEPDEDVVPDTDLGWTRRTSASARCTAAQVQGAAASARPLRPGRRRTSGSARDTAARIRGTVLSPGRGSLGRRTSC